MAFVVTIRSPHATQAVARLDRTSSSADVVRDMLRHPSLQTKVRSAKMQLVSNKRAFTRRRTFMVSAVILAATLVAYVFWPVARMSRFSHAARVRQLAWNASRVNESTPVLWDSACKNEDVLG